MTARRFCVGLGCLVLLGGGAILAQPKSPKKYALLVGINRYNHTELNQPKHLEFAEADVTAAAEVFRKAGYEVEVISGEKATLATIRAALKGLAKKGSGDGAVVVGVAGHGIQPDGGAEAYFCPHDAGKHVTVRDGKQVDDWDADTLLPLTEVLTHLRACPAGAKLVLADCCRNDPKSGRGRGVGSELKIGDLPRNTAVLLSCSRGQRAYEDKKWGGGHGAFFYHVLEGLNGKGSDDGKVTADSLWRYVSKAVPAAVESVIGGGADQKPTRLVFGEVDLQVATALARPQAPGPSGSDLAAGEKVEEFEYVIEGEKKKGTRRVLTVDIGGGASVEFVRIPKGTFMMGAPAGEKDTGESEKPQHRVEISRDFYLGKFELTQAQYRAVTGESPSEFKGDNLPVEKVSHDEAAQFCRKVSGTTGRTIVLPTEAQWEYACRAGTTTPYHFGSKLNGDLATCHGYPPYGTETKGPSKQSTMAVGSYPSNPWGLYDMHGNVSEWCGDWVNKYSSANSRDPLGPGTGLDRVVRGGSWDSFAVHCRSATRDWGAPEVRNNHLGFRLALESPVK